MSDHDHTEHDDTPTEPRESESGQEQATDTADGTVADEERVDGERDTHEEHPDTESSEHGATHGSVEPATTRTTAPMSAFSTREVGMGIAVLAVGVLIAFVIPLVFV